MKKYAISDIHGCFHTFKELLNKIGLNKTDELYLLGDYINRGSNSKEVIDFVIYLQNKDYSIKTLKGNHEEMVFDSIELEGWTNGEEETLKSFGINHLKELDKKYINWFLNLDLFIENDEFIFVHAGLNFDTSNPLENMRSTTWIRDWYNSINYDWLGNRKIIHGHTPKEKFEIEKMINEFEQQRVLNIDNGCFMKETNGYGNLCCVELNNMELTFQKNID